MLQEPYLSPYDLQFKLFGFPVRIAWGFWALAAVLGFEFVRDIDAYYYETGRSTPSTFALLIIHALALCLSILIHELGHAYLFRYYGEDSRIVLYHFGGLAITGSLTDWNAARRRPISHPYQSIAISAAGPIFQLLVGIAVWSLVTMLHINVGVTDWVKDNWGLPLPEGLDISNNAIIQVFCETFINTSVLWSLLNLLPILPLDGGQIAREVLRIYGVPNPVNRAALISMIVAGALMLLSAQFGRGSGLMCLFLLASNFQLYQQTRYGGY